LPPFVVVDFDLRRDSVGDGMNTCVLVQAFVVLVPSVGIARTPAPVMVSA
jgi:hypothetical protein